MARTSTAKADEFNAQQEALRQQAREGDSNVVDLLSIEERIEADNEYRRKLADTLDMHLDMIELAQERIRALKTEAQANGVIWPAMLAMVKLRRLEFEKREEEIRKAKLEADERRKSARALGLDRQLVLFFDEAPARASAASAREAGLQSARGTPAPAADDLAIIPADEEELGSDDASLLARAGIGSVVASDD
jgi:hypothetical protein